MSKEPTSGLSPKWQGAKPKPLFFTLLVGFVLWYMPHPEGITDQAWHLLAIFIATIAGIVLHPLPVAGVAMMGMVATMLTHTLTPEQAFSAYSKHQLWLIVLAFFMAHGLIKTGLAVRISYWFLRVLGKRTITLAYGLSLSELVLAPFVPSVVARSGGIIFPVVAALTKDFEETYGKSKVAKLQKFLIMAAFQGSAVCSAIFLTSMAANPLAVNAAEKFGVEITWVGWAQMAIVPGVINLLMIPALVYWLVKPEMTETPEAPKLAAKKLKEMGPIRSQEWTMLATFLVVLTMWLMEKQLGIASSTAALVGVTGLLITGVLTWRDCLEQHAAWDALFWLAALVAMGSHLKEFGLFDWLSEAMFGVVGSYSWPIALFILLLVYFYSHYFFASNTAHVTAMYAAFLGTAISVGAPPLLAALIFACASSLFGGITHYASGPAPIYYGTRYVELGEWWRVGLIVSLVNIATWLVVGSIWWKVIGMW